MKESDRIPAQMPTGAQNGESGQNLSRLRGFIVAAVVLVLCFSLPLYGLVRFAIQSELYSHIVLIPFISGYLVWLRRRTLPPPSSPDRRTAAVPSAIGAVLLAGYWIAALSGTELAREDSLALTTLSFLMFFGAACGLFLGRPTLHALAFPLGFLVFMVPIPVFLTDGIETFLQHSSAAVAYGFFKLSGTPVFYQGLSFQLPGFSFASRLAMQRHPFQSGFVHHQSAGWLLLPAHPWKRATLALAVMPLAMLRNGFRVFMIGELCVDIGPEMGNSYIHRHGGPLFFVLSLVPFFLLLFFLMRSDRRAATPASGNPGA